MGYGMRVLISRLYGLWDVRLYGVVIIGLYGLWDEGINK